MIKFLTSKNRVFSILLLCITIYAWIQGFKESPTDGWRNGCIMTFVFMCYVIGMLGYYVFVIRERCKDYVGGYFGNNARHGYPTESEIVGRDSIQFIFDNTSQAHKMYNVDISKAVKR